MNQGISELFRRALDHRLRKILGSDYVSKGQTEKRAIAPINLWLAFEGMSLIRILGSADGATLLADQVMPEPSDMDEAGEIVIRDVSKKFAFHDALNKNLQAVSIIAEAGLRSTVEEQVVVGVRFDFGLNIRPIVLNWGDELYIGSRFPPDGDEAMFSEIPV